MKLFARTPIIVGTETVAMTEQSVSVGEDVEIYSVLGNHRGTKVIARGTVIAECKDENGAPITPSNRGNTRNAWKDLFRVKVTKIEE